MLYIYHTEQKIPTQKNQTKLFNHRHFLKPKEIPYILPEYSD